MTWKCNCKLMDEFRTDNKIAVFGPYIGDLREEVFSFRPFVK
ncbi:MAG: hypothetical protein ACOC2W_04015 [bacterium]